MLRIPDNSRRLCHGVTRRDWLQSGGGVGRGQVVGRSDKITGDVAENPVSPKDILATILHLLGIGPHTTIPHRVNQPMPVAGTGKLRPNLLSS